MLHKVQAPSRHGEGNTDTGASCRCWAPDHCPVTYTWDWSSWAQLFWRSEWASRCSQRVVVQIRVLRLPFVGVLYVIDLRCCRGPNITPARFAPHGGREGTMQHREHHSRTCSHIERTSILYPSSFRRPASPAWTGMMSFGLSSAGCHSDLMRTPMQRCCPIPVAHASIRAGALRHRQHRGMKNIPRAVPSGGELMHLAISPAEAGLLLGILKPILTVLSLGMIGRIILAWYPEIDMQKLPWSFVYWPTGDDWMDLEAAGSGIVPAGHDVCPSKHQPSIADNTKPHTALPQNRCWRPRGRSSNLSMVWMCPPSPGLRSCRS